MNYEFPNLFFICKRSETLDFSSMNGAPNSILAFRIDDSRRRFPRRRRWTSLVVLSISLVSPLICPGLVCQNIPWPLKDAGSSGFRRLAASTRLTGEVPGSSGNTLGFYDATATLYRMVIDSSGKVGIGTAAPLDTLHVNGANSVVGLGEYQGANLLYNGSAEDGAPPAPTGWTSRDFAVDGSAGSGSSVSNGTAYNGANIFRGVNDGGMNQAVNVVPGGIYTISARVRVSNINNADASNGQLVVGTTTTGRDVVDKSCNPNTFDATPNFNKWVLCSATFTAPAASDVATTTIYVGFRAQGSSHSTDFDALTLARGGMVGGYSPLASFIGSNPATVLSGNVGIGTTSPLGKLVISNAGANGIEITPGTTAFTLTNTNYIASYDRSLSAYKDLVFDTGLSTLPTLILKAGGNVGIGTTNPGAMLDISKSNSGASNTLQIQNTSNTGSSNAVLALAVGGTSGGSPYINFSGPSITNTQLGLDAADSFKFKIGNTLTGTNWLTINTANGNVGIGTTSPLYKLHSNGLVGITNLGTAVVGGGIRFDKDATPTVSWSIGGSNKDGTLTSDLYIAQLLSSAWTDRVTIQSGGNVGIGTTNPAATLEVAGTTQVRDIYTNYRTAVNALSDTQTMVPNGGFEIYSGSTATGWISGGTSGSTSLETSSPAQGSVSQKIYESSNTQVYYVQSGCFPITGGRAYNVYVRAKTDSGAPNANLLLDLSTYSSKANCQSTTSPTDNYSSYFTPSTSYADYGQSITPIAGQNWAEVVIWNASPSNAQTLTVDSVRVIPASLTVGTDLAESYAVSEQDVPQPGDLVTLSAETSSSGGIAHAVKTSKPYDRNVFGIVSTQPGYVLDDGQPYFKTNVALSGRVPTRVSTENGSILIGDRLTSSSIPGVAMKATKPGFTIGKALRSYDSPDISSVGEVETFVNLSWYDPNIIITPDGNFKITGVPSVPTSSAAASPATSFQITNSAGEIVNEVGAFSKAFVANLTAGLVNTVQLIVDSASIGTLQTGLISPQSGHREVVIELPVGQDGDPGSFVIRDDRGTTVFSVTAGGSATLAGTLTTNGLTVGSQSASGSATPAVTVYGNASVSGTLFADQIKGKTVDDIMALVNALTRQPSLIANITDVSSSPSANSQTATALATPSVVPAPSGDPLVASVSSWLADSNNVSQDATTSGTLSVLQKVIFQNTLAVLGRTSLADTSIAGTLLVDGSLEVTGNTIGTVASQPMMLNAGGTLYLQSLGMGPIDILSGKITIDTSGNLSVEGNLTVKGKIAASELDVSQNATVSGGLTTGKLDTNVLSAQSGNFEKLLIAPEKNASASASLGKAVIPAGQTAVHIQNTLMTEDSEVFITLSTLITQNVAVTEKTPGEGFTVAIKNPEAQDLKFTWWIIN